MNFNPVCISRTINKLKGGIEGEKKGREKKGREERIHKKI